MWLEEKLGTKMGHIHTVKAVYNNVPKHMLGSGIKRIVDPGLAITSEYQGRHNLSGDDHKVIH